ncbi:hypothetical protein SALBM135S_03967 [Streptomyces alboniger]
MSARHVSAPGEGRASPPGAEHSRGPDPDGPAPQVR